MNPNQNQPSGMNLPPPMVSTQPELSRAGNPNVLSAGYEPVPAGGNAQSSTAGFPLPVPTAPLPLAMVNNVISTTNNSMPAVADDTDLIEKEWVQKAKEIVSNTHNDPHLQSIELNIFKADYMQKRYNKVLKLSE